MFPIRCTILMAVIAMMSSLVRAETPADPVSPWREGVRIAPVSAVPGRHTIYSYYVCNP